MAERANVNQKTQWGKETTAGTAVAANKLLPSISINMSPERLKQNFRAQGYKSTTVTTDDGGWAQGTWESPVDFNQIIWPMEGLVGISAPTGAGAAKTWAYAPAATGADSNQKTFTVERGDSSAARQFVQFQFRSLQIEATRRNGSRMSGNCFARYPTDGLTLTASPTAVAQRPVGATMWDIYLDPTFGAIGTTKLASAYSVGMALGDKYNPFWALNTSFPSYKDTVEIAHDINGVVRIAHNAQSRAIFAAIPDNAVQYLRYEAISAVELQTGIFEKITVDMAVQIGTPADGDEDGVFGVEYNFETVYDASLGGNWKITAINSIAAI